MEQLRRMMDRRRSVRSYLPDALPEDMLTALRRRMDSLTPLFPDTPVTGMIIPTAAANFLQKWKTPHFIAIFSDGSEEGLINVGFMYQQLDLYLQAQGLGSCWVGLGSLKDSGIVPEGMKLAVMMAVGRPDKAPARQGAQDFNRRTMADIADQPDERLEPLRLAPSATNSQPWYITHAGVTHEGDTLHIWREALGRIKQRTHGRMNLIDTGIALAHLYVSHPDTFRFTREEAPPALDGYVYMGSVTL